MCTGRPSAKAERMAESAEALAAQAGESTAVTASHSSWLRPQSPSCAAGAACGRTTFSSIACSRAHSLPSAGSAPSPPPTPSRRSHRCSR